MKTDSIEMYIPMIPPSANVVWRRNPNSNKPFFSPSYKAFKDLVAWRCTGRKFPKEWKWASVELIFHMKTRSGDVDNRIKPTLDALTQAGFWEDDKCVAEVHARFGRIDKKGSVLIIVRECKEKFPDTD